MRKVTVLVLCMLVVALFAGAAVSAQDEPVVIGFVIDETGVGAIFAEAQVAGLEIALKHLNERGGILGREVSYIKQDAQLDASLASTIAEQMILEDGVDFLLAGTSSGTALAISAVAAEQKVVVAFHTSNSVKLTIDNWHPYMMQLVPHTNIEGRAAAAFLAGQGFSTIATIAPDYAFGRDSWGAFQPRFAEEAPTASIITEQWPPLADRDMNPYLTAIQSNGPEGIYSALWGEQLVTFLQAAEDFGLFDESQFIGLMDTDVMKAMGADMPEGLLGYARAPFYGVDNEAMDAFVAEYLETYNEYPSDWAITVYDSVMALAAAAEAAGSTEGDAVSAQIGGLTFASLRGELTIRECDHMANVGEYVGITSMSEEFGIPVLADVQYIPAEDLWDSCEAIEARRAEVAAGS